MNEKPFFPYAIQPAQALGPQQAALVSSEESRLERRKKKSSSWVGLISAVSRDLQLKGNTRLVPRKRMGLQLGDLG